MNKLSPEKIVERIKELQNQTIVKLHKDLIDKESIARSIVLDQAHDAVISSFERHEEKTDMQRKLKYELITQNEYDHWLERQKKIELMNKEIYEEKISRNKKNKFDAEILNIAFHISYMLNLYQNPNFNPSRFILRWDEFNRLIKEHKIENDPYISKIISEFHSKSESEQKEDAMLKIWGGVALFAIFFLILRGCQ